MMAGLFKRLNRPKFNRPRGHGRPAAVAVAAIGAGGGEQRSCHHCGKKGHLRHQCPNLHPEVKKFLALGRGNAGNPGKGK